MQKTSQEIKRVSHLNVSRIIVKRTNLPKSGTTKLVGGIISASSKKNTVNDSKIDIAKLTYLNIYLFYFFKKQTTGF